VLFAVIASLGGDGGSESLSLDHSNTLTNASIVMINLKTTTGTTESTTTFLTTTVATTTTTTVSPSTAVPPTLPTQHRWSVTDGGNVCLLLESGIRMKFNYVKQVLTAAHCWISLQ